MHELAHLSAFNHSKMFWDLVSRTMPQYKALRKELRTGYALQADMNAKVDPGMSADRLVGS